MYKNLERFWQSQSDLISWFKQPKKVLNKDKKNKRYKWYSDGKLNIYHNCIENNLKKNKNKIAIKCLDKENNIREFSYYQLYLMVEKLSANLNKIKIKKLKVAIHAPSSIESAISMLACCKLGIEFTVIFQTLPIESVFTRLKIFKPNLLITKCNTEEIKQSILPLVNKYNKTKKQKIKILYFNSKKKFKNHTSFNLNFVLSSREKFKKTKTKHLESEKPSFVLFTSGSTGNPKGVQHTTGGYILYTKLTCIKQFGMNSNSVVLTLSDAGWINGHSYALFGPLSLGATTFLVEDPMIMLSFNTLVTVLKEHKISVLYLPVTIIRLLKAIIPNKQINLPHLQCIGSMGEPLAQNVAKWFSKIFSKSKLPVVNTYFQTETGGIICSPRYNSTNPNLLNGTVGKPLNKYINLNVHKKNYNKSKELKIISPWPGCMKNIINGKKIYNNYFDKNNNFKLFDIGKLDENNNLLVFGRSDDVMNVRGHRIGSGEIEDQILKINLVKEVCAISCKDDIEGEKIVIFFSKKENKDINLINDINDKICNFFGNWAKPKFVIELSQLPKTRSGKILRRILRILINNPKEKNIGDVSTIFDKNIIDEIRIKSLCNY
jgi:acetyl-CoA synthetase